MARVGPQRRKKKKVALNKQKGELKWNSKERKVREWN
jgi:hypothetical protein